MTIERFPFPFCSAVCISNMRKRSKKKKGGHIEYSNDGVTWLASSFCGKTQLNGGIFNGFIIDDLFSLAKIIINVSF